MEESLPFYNPWWTREEVPAHLVKKYKRDAFRDIERYLKINRIVVIKGPRRVGKTTIIYQLIDELLKRGVNPRNILYLSFDDPKLRTDFDEIIDFYQTNILKSSVEKESTYIFLDEVQYLDNWQYCVKKYYDRKYPIKFIASGSSSSLILKGTESLMGRTIEEVLLPFSFKDFLQYNLKREIEGISLESLDYLSVKKYENQAKILFNEYMFKGGFPNIFEVKEKEIWQKLVKEDVIDKAIYRDIVSMYDIKSPETLEKLFMYLVGISGQIMNVSNISNSIGLSREYVKKYILYLKNAYFLFSAKKYAKSIEKIIRSNEKIYIIDPAIINSLLNKESIDERFAGHLVETMVARHLIKHETYYWKNSYEIDFIIRTKKGLMPIEVKYKKGIKGPDYKNLFSFMERFDLKEGIVVTKNLLREDRIKSNKSDLKRILFIPAWLFLLTQ